MSFIVNTVKDAAEGVVKSVHDTLSGHFGSALQDVIYAGSGGMLGHLSSSGPHSSSHMLGSIPTWKGGQSTPSFTDTVTNIHGGRGIAAPDLTRHLNQSEPDVPLVHAASGPVQQPDKNGHLGPMHPLFQPRDFRFLSRYDYNAGFEKWINNKVNRRKARSRMNGSGITAPSANSSVQRVGLKGRPAFSAMRGRANA